MDPTSPISYQRKALATASRFAFFRWHSRPAHSTWRGRFRSFPFGKSHSGHRHSRWVQGSPTGWSLRSCRFHGIAIGFGRYAPRSRFGVTEGIVGWPLGLSREMDDRPEPRSQHLRSIARKRVKERHSLRSRPSALHSVQTRPGAL